MAVVLKVILSVLTSVACLLSSTVFGNFAGGYEPKKEDCKLTFASISDTHLMEYPEKVGKLILLEMGLYDMEKAENPLDALVISGDFTNNGKRAQYEKAEKSFAKYTPAKNILFSNGNHDAWAKDVETQEEKIALSKELFIEYNKKIANREVDNVYYSQVINGYTFIVLGSEGSENDDPVISDEQLAMLDAELAKATADGKPAFVVSHWPFKGTHGLPNTWEGAPADEVVPDLDPGIGGFGERNDEIFAVMNKYNNVVLISGHIHNGIVNNVEDTVYGYSSVEMVDKVCSVNLPVYHTVTNRGTTALGMGFVFEVYDSEIIIRARSFSGGVWYTGNEFIVPIVKTAN